MAVRPVKVECGRWADPRMFEGCARVGLVLAHGAVGDQAPQTVTRVNHVVKRGARVEGARADRVGGGAVVAMRFAQARCMRLARTNTVRMVALHKHGAAKCRRTKTVHRLGRRVFTTQLGK